MKHDKNSETKPLEKVEALLCEVLGRLSIHDKGVYQYRDEDLRAVNQISFVLEQVKQKTQEIQERIFKEQDEIQPPILEERDQRG